MNKTELKLKIIEKEGNKYYIDEFTKKWIFFKYPEIKKDILDTYMKDLTDKKDTIIIVNTDFVNIKDNTIFYNSKFVNYKKATE